MSNSSKPLTRTELAAAGRRKLEEFRKQKAAAAAKTNSTAPDFPTVLAAQQPAVQDAVTSSFSSWDRNLSAPGQTRSAAVPQQGVRPDDNSTAALPLTPPSESQIASTEAPAASVTKNVPTAASATRPSWLPTGGLQDRTSVPRLPVPTASQPEMRSAAASMPAFLPQSRPPWLPAPQAPASSTFQIAPVTAASSASRITSAPSRAAADAAVEPDSTATSLPPPAIASLGSISAPLAPATADTSSTAGKEEQRRLPPPMPKLFDWHALGKSQSQSSPKDSQPLPPLHQHLQQDDEKLPRPREVQGSQPSSSQEPAPGSSEALASFAILSPSAVLSTPGTADSRGDAAAWVHSEALGKDVRSRAAGEGSAEEHRDLGDLGAAFAAFVEDDDAQRQAGRSGSRGGLLSSLFTRRGSEAAAAGASEQAAVGSSSWLEKGSAMAGNHIGTSNAIPEQIASLGDSEADLADGESNDVRQNEGATLKTATPSELASGYAVLNDSHSAPSPVSGVGRQQPAGGTLAGGYGALSDAYLAPGKKQLQSNFMLNPPPTAASSRTSSFASGYAVLSDRYAVGEAGEAEAAGAQVPGQSSRLASVPFPSHASLGSVAGTGRGSANGTALAAEAGDSPAGSSGVTSLADVGNSTAPAETASMQHLLPGASSADAVEGRTAAGSSAGAGGSVWTSPPPQPPSHHSSTNLTRFTPPQSTQSRGNDFKALQQHIDELTEEKFTLLRGLEQQSRLAGQLADENEALSLRFNDQAKQVDALQREVAQLQQALTEQVVIVERAATERDAYKLSAQEAQSRAQLLQSLAAEVVRLEDSVLKLRSQELRVGREAEGATEVVRAMQAQLEALTRERTGLLTQLDSLRNEGAELRSKLRAAEVAAASVTEAAAAAAAAPQQQQAEAVQVEEHQQHGPAERTAAGAPSASSGGVAVHSQGAGATDLDYKSTPAEPAPSETPRAARAKAVARSVSAAVARAALAAQQHGASAGTNVSSASEEEEESEEHDEGLESIIPPDLLAMLPAKLAAAGDADVVGSDGVLALVQSIYLMLAALEVDRQQLVVALNRKQDEVATLQGANRQLAHRLETSQQRMELMSQQMCQQHGSFEHAEPATSRGGSSTSTSGQSLANGMAHPGTRGGWGAAQKLPISKRPGLQYLNS